VPQGWEKPKLGDLVELVMGQAPPGRECNKDGIGTPFVKVGEFGEERPIIREWTTKPLKLAQKGDVLVCVVGATCGKINLGEDCAIGRSVAAVRPRNGLDQRFLYNFLKTKILDLRSGSVGSAQGVISKDDLSSILNPLPPHNEQRRIVGKIDALMERSGRAKNTLDAIPALLDQYRQSVLAAAFRGNLTADWRKQNPEVEPAAELLERIRAERRQKWGKVELAKMRTKGKEPTNNKWKAKYKEPDIDGVTSRFDIPATWRWVSVDFLCPVVQYGSSAKTNDDESGVPVLRMGNLINGKLDFSNLKFLSHKHEEFPLLHLSGGDILFNRTNSAELVGKCAVYRGSPEPCSFASYLIRLKTVGVRPELLSGYINSPYGRAWVASVVSQQVGQANVNGTKLKALATPLPPQAEQAEISRQIHQANRMIDTVSATFDETSGQLSTLNQSILAKAFRGDLVPQDPDDEPASILLERIRAEREAAAANKPKRGRRKKAK